jgi:hypothetical protein
MTRTTHPWIGAVAGMLVLGLALGTAAAQDTSRAGQTGQTGETEMPRMPGQGGAVDTAGQRTGQDQPSDVRRRSEVGQPGQDTSQAGPAGAAGQDTTKAKPTKTKHGKKKLRTQARDTSRARDTLETGATGAATDTSRAGYDTTRMQPPGAGRDTSRMQSPGRDTTP